MLAVNPVPLVDTVDPIAPDVGLNDKLATANASLTRLKPRIKKKLMPAFSICSPHACSH